MLLSKVRDWKRTRSAFVPADQGDPESSDHESTAIAKSPPSRDDARERSRRALPEPGADAVAAPLSPTRTRREVPHRVARLVARRLRLRASSRRAKEIPPVLGAGSRLVSRPRDASTTAAPRDCSAESRPRVAALPARSRASSIPGDDETRRLARRARPSRAATFASCSLTRRATPSSTIAVSPRPSRRRGVLRSRPALAHAHRRALPSSSSAIGLRFLTRLDDALRFARRLAHKRRPLDQEPGDAPSAEP